MTTNALKIRLAEPRDAAEISRLLYEAFVQYRERYTAAGFSATAISEAEIQVRMGEGPVWVSEYMDEIVGTVSIIGSGRSLYIRGMAVRPAARGQRIGESLLTTIEQFAKSEGFERLYLSTTPFLDRAIRLYERFGFRRVTDSDSDLHGTPLFTMEKTLLSEARP